jgi:hypothetical protein
MADQRAAWRVVWKAVRSGLRWAVEEAVAKVDWTDHRKDCMSVDK